MRNLTLPFAASAAALALAAACSNPVGPPLSVEVVSQRLVPTASATATGPQIGAPIVPANICCCRVKGEVRNTGTVTSHIQLVWMLNPQARLARPSVGQGRDFLRDVMPGETRTFDAAGLFEACSKLSFTELERQVTPFGVYLP